MQIGRNKDQRWNAAELQIGGYIFEGVEDFKYLGANLSITNDNHEEIKKTYDIRQKNVFTPSQGYWGQSYYKKKIKRTIFLHGTRPMIMYACETWPTTQEDENRLAIMERKFLRKIYGLKETKTKHTK
jgi:hypothetical protein